MQLPVCSQREKKGIKMFLHAQLTIQRKMNMTEVVSILLIGLIIGGMLFCFLAEWTGTHRDDKILLT